MCEAKTSVTNIPNCFQENIGSEYICPVPHSLNGGKTKNRSKHMSKRMSKRGSKQYGGNFCGKGEQLGVNQACSGEPSASEIAWSNRYTTGGSRNSKQKGGNGYYPNVSEQPIAGRPVVRSYLQCCPPVFKGSLTGGQSRKNRKYTLQSQNMIAGALSNLINIRNEMKGGGKGSQYYSFKHLLDPNGINKLVTVLGLLILSKLFRKDRKNRKSKQLGGANHYLKMLQMEKNKNGLSRLLAPMTYKQLSTKEGMKDLLKLVSNRYKIQRGGTLPSNINSITTVLGIFILSDIVKYLSKGRKSRKSKSKGNKKQEGGNSNAYCGDFNLQKINPKTTGCYNPQWNTKCI